MANMNPTNNGEDDITPAREVPTPANVMREKTAEFLASHSEDSSFTYEEERRVLRRVDQRILPLLLGAYFFQQLDKSSLR